MRTEVVEDIKQMKWEFFRASTHPDGKVPCALTSRLLSLEEAMIDHAPPKTFKALAERFLDENRIVPSEALLTPVSSDGSASCCDKSSTHSSQSPSINPA